MNNTIKTNEPLELKATKSVPEFIPGEDFQTMYVNAVNLEVSNWDVRMRLGLVQDIVDGTVRVKELTHVFMSHSHARAFYKAMGEIMAKLDTFDKSGQQIKAEE